MIQGSCLCGAVNWEILIPVGNVVLCHCSQCRRHQGSFGAPIINHISSTQVKNLSNLCWFRSSEEGERGYCKKCGSKMFWREVGSDKLYPNAGTARPDSSLEIEKHIFTDSKGDYYNIPPGLPCYAASSQGAAPVTKISAKAPLQNLPQHRGRCLCGKIHFVVTGKMRPVVYCHCGQCLTWHGFYPGYSAARKDQITLHGEEYLEWYRSSDAARRGFCKECGSSLFWQSDKKDFTSITAGSLDAPTDLEEGWHIFVKDKPAWYRLNDGLRTFEGTTPQNAQF